MKRLFLTVVLLLACVYMLPVFTVGLESAGQADDGTSGGESPSAGGDFDQSTVITLCDGGEVKELKLCDYLKGVLAAEMPASFPIEALKAQAVAARTYTLYQLSLYDSGMEAPESHNGAQLCSDYTHCKAYRDVDAQKESLWGSDADFYYDKIKSAVDDTSGIIATYKGEPIAAVFHAASSEMTESSLSVWGTEMPYLVSVESPGGEESPKYNGTVEISAEDFKSKMLESYPEMDFSQTPDKWFKASQRSEAGGVETVAVGGVRVSGVWLRQQLGLNSTNFTYEVSGDTLRFQTKGYGHGVGMSQYGAKALAEQGKTYDEIIKWYYTGVDLTIK